MVALQEVAAAEIAVKSAAKAEIMVAVEVVAKIAAKAALLGQIYLSVPQVAEEEIAI